MTPPSQMDPPRSDEVPPQQPAGSEPSAPYPPTAPPPGVGEGRSKTISVLALVCGTAALLLGLIPGAGIFIGGLFGTAALVLGIIGIVKSHRIVSIVGIVLAVVGTTLSFAITDAVDDADADGIVEELVTFPAELDIDPVVDDVFEFTVTGIEQGLSEVGSEDVLKKQAEEGEFVVIDLTVTNIGSEISLFSDSLQRLIDTDGNEHSASSSAGIYFEGNNFTLTAVNPGDQIQGKVVFDVPVGTEAAKLVLHGSTSSEGVEVSLP